MIHLVEYAIRRALGVSECSVLQTNLQYERHDAFARGKLPFTFDGPVKVGDETRYFDARGVVECRGAHWYGTDIMIENSEGRWEFRDLEVQ